jgi:hypothetical protein
MLFPFDKPIIIHMFSTDDGLLEVPSRRDQNLVIKNDVLQAAESFCFFCFFVIDDHERDDRRRVADRTGANAINLREH